MRACRSRRRRCCTPSAPWRETPPRRGGRRRGGSAATSCAVIERDTSIASTTVASLRGMLTWACGRAAPMMSATRAASRIPSGIVRRRPGRPETRFGMSAGVENAAAWVSRRRSWRRQSTASAGTATSAISTRGWPKLTGALRETPRTAAASRRTSRGPRAGRASAERTRATPLRSSSAASAKRSRSARLRVSTRTWRPVSGSTSHRSPTSGSSCSRGSRISTASTSCRLISCSSGFRQSSGPRKSDAITTTPRCRAIARRGRWRPPATSPRVASAPARAATPRAGRAGRRGPGGAAA